MKSITITQGTHIMGPNGEIIATLYPTDKGKGFLVDLDFEHVDVKINGNDVTQHYICPSTVSFSMSEPKR